jgi:hypothetical protein
MDSDQDFSLAPHPLYPLPTKAQFEADPEGVERYLTRRAARIRLEQADPWRYGVVPEVWHYPEDAIRAGKREILLLGGNRATKSYYCGRKVIDIMLSGPRKTCWCLQSTYDNSVEMQQPILYHYIPLEFKNLRKGRVTNISFTQKMGFSDGKFIFPNASECIFRNYSQKDEVIEGGNCDLIWCDELVPLNWIETLRYRLVTRRGILLISFTPMKGWTPTVKEYLDGARTLERVPAPLLPKGSLGRGGNFVPRLQQPQRENAAIIYFHTSDNPFEGYATMQETLEGASRDEILCRAYGVPTRSIVQLFPRFNDRVHVVPPGKIPREGTRYQIVDPAGNRNWFMIWVLVDANNIHWVYREWPPLDYIPGVGHPGAWAEADGKLADGRAGPAQTGFGWGLQRYVDEIHRCEAREEIAERWIDSRFANLPTQKSDASTTLLEEMALLGMPFAPAPNDAIQEGVSLINSMLDYDEASGKAPTLYISEACQNVIFALKIWSGKDGQLGATKDPIDCLRYMAVGNLVDFARDGVMIAAGGAY